MNPVDDIKKSEFFGLVHAGLGKETFDSWFTNIALNQDGNKIIIPLPNSFFVNYFTSNFTELLSSAVVSVFGAGFELKLTSARPDKASSENITPSPVDRDMPDSAVRVEVSSPPSCSLSLNPNYTFENYVVGPCNRLAHAAALAVTENLGKAYNPLFIHGSFGVGKSHLIQAICHALVSRYTGISISFMSCEEFVNNYISALSKNKLEEFRNINRKLDVLLIDDIHFLAKKESSQEEFFHTFNSLHNAEKQIILSSDAPAKDLPAIQERLISRLLWGMEARIDPPGYETRFAIIKQKAEKLSFILSDDIVDYLALNLTTNIRELEGAVNNIYAQHSLTNTSMTIENVKNAIKNIVEPVLPSVKITDIQEGVARYFHLKLSDLQAKKRAQSVSLPRQIAIFLAKKMTPHSLEEIGGFFGGRDHSTVIHSVNKIEARGVKDPQFKALLGLLEQKIHHKEI